MSSASEFFLTETVDGDEIVISLTGELDLVSAPRLAEVLRGHLQAGRRQLIDLTEVSFMDSSGLGAIVTSAHGEQARSLLRIRRSRHPQPNRLLDLTGVTEILAQVEP